MTDVEAALTRVQSQLGPADYDLFRRLVNTLAAVTSILNSQRAMIARLRRLFGLGSSERSRNVLGKDKPATESTPPSSEDAPTSTGSQGDSASSEPPAATPAAADKLKGHGRLEGELHDKRVEPNSGLGKAYNYMLKRWDKLTLFLRKAGVPLDNNACEQALKLAIRHRRNSLFYRSERGAEVGDMLMSLLHTAQLRAENPFEYLAAVLQNEKAVAAHPADWLPWTYRATLERLVETSNASAAQTA
jgi:Transposase IS66 family